MDKAIQAIREVAASYPGEPEDVERVVSYVCDTLDLFFVGLRYDAAMVRTVVRQMVRQVQVIDPEAHVEAIPEFLTVEEKDDYFNQLMHYVPVPEPFQETWQQYQYLANLPQPVQRTQEWYDMRNSMITASAGAQAMGESKYDKPDKLILDKIGHGEKFGENKFVHHGKKYEKIATMIYEHIYNVKVGEFGLVPHQPSRKPTPHGRVAFIGASPDGICTSATLDGGFSPMVGRMLEIKCPLSREIKTSGEEDGEICPHYYWVQVQLQLECCDLEDCDFWQCSLKECADLEEWVEETTAFEETYTVEQGEKISFDDRLKCGMILQFLPRKHDLARGERLEWYGKYIYPPRLDMSVDEYHAWCRDMIRDHAKFYPELANDYYFDRVLYWRLQSSHNINIKRNRAWFASALPKLRAFWDRVLLYKGDEEEKRKFLESMAPKPVAAKSASSSYSVCMFVDDTDSD
jgi:putative phage-type endonuclease